MTELRKCSECRYLRQKEIVNPFSITDAFVPEILEEKAKWEKELKEIALAEQQRFEAGEEFDYEPNNYPWCERWTTEHGGTLIDPVTGDERPIFLLCARANADGNCDLFEKQELS